MTALDDDLAFAALAQALVWRLRQRQPGMRSGAHRGRLAGAGDALADLAPLIAHPDPRRLDLRRSIADPFGGLSVRRFQIPAPVTLHVILDASASLAARGAADRRGMAALLAGAFAAAAALCGDASALWTARGDETAAVFPPGRGRERGAAFRAAALAADPVGRGPDGIIGLAPAIPARRSFVVLVSDMELAPEELDRALAAFEDHALIPIWLRDSGLEALAESDLRWPRLARLADPESGAAQLVLLTARRAAAWAAERAGRRAALRAVFAAHGREPVEAVDRIEIAGFAEAINRTPA